MSYILPTIFIGGIALIIIAVIFTMIKVTIDWASNMFEVVAFIIIFIVILFLGVVLPIYGGIASREMEKEPVVYLQFTSSQQSVQASKTCICIEKV